MLICGFALLYVVVRQAPSAKTAILITSMGVFLILIGVNLSAGFEEHIEFSLRRRWIRFVPVAIVLAAFILGPFVTPLIIAMVLAVAVTLAFVLSKETDIPRAYITLYCVFIAASICYFVFHYYALDIGIDSWGYLSVAAAIIQSGHYTGTFQPIDIYYTPLPVMAIAPAVLSAVTTLSLPVAVLIFPGSLILAQPLIVFLLARRMFNNSESAAFSALIVITEAAAIQWIAQPIAQSTAISILLVTMLLILIAHRDPSPSHFMVILVLFVMVAVIHGAVGIISLPIVLILFRERHIRGGLPRLFALIFFAYLIAASLIGHFLQDVGYALTQLTSPSLFGSTVQSASSQFVTSFYGVVSNGLMYVWWGLPPSLALVAILFRKKIHAPSWAYIGLVILGLSFVANVAAPSLYIDRYGGLIGWLILAVSGGSVLSGITRTRRQVLLLIPLLLIVSLSGIVDPYVSPQYGFMGYQQTPTAYRYYDLPTTQNDRVALQWIATNTPKLVISDHYAAAYLLFSRYQFGVITPEIEANYYGLSVATFSQVHLVHPTPQPYFGFLFRWSNAETSGNACVGLVTSIAQQQGFRAGVNILFNNSCDVVETSPLWYR